jgi:hypothetical protein
LFNWRELSPRAGMKTALRRRHSRLEWNSTAQPIPVGHRLQTKRKTHDKSDPLISVKYKSIICKIQ